MSRYKFAWLNPDDPVLEDAMEFTPNTREIFEANRSSPSYEVVVDEPNFYVLRPISVSQWSRLFFAWLE